MRVAGLVICLTVFVAVVNSESGEAKRETAAQVPIEMVEGWPGVRVWIGDGAEPYLFLLDTGSNATIFFDPVWEDQAITAFSEEEAETFFGSERVRVGEQVRITVDSSLAGYRYVRPIQFGNGVLRRRLEQFEGQFDGVLGMEAFARTRVDMNFGDEPFLRVAYAGGVPASFQVEVPKIDLEVNGVALSCSLDTGGMTDQGLRVRAHAPQGAAIIDSASRTLTRLTPWRNDAVVKVLIGDVSTGGSSRPMMVRVEELSSDGGDWDHAAAASEAMPDCLLGIDAGRALHVSYDLIDQQAVARYIRAPALVVNRTGIGGARWLGEAAEILSVDPDSPAEEAGLSQGDLIVALETQPVDRAGFIALGEAMTDEARSHLHLQIERQGELFEVELALRDML